MLSRVEFEGHGGEEVELSIVPEAIFVITRLVFNLVVGEVEAEELAFVVAASAGRPVPAHGVGIITFVDIDQAVGIAFIECDLLFAES